MGRAPVESKKEDIIEVPISSSYDTIADWLLSLGMQQYLSLFVTNGFNDIDFLVRDFHRFLFLFTYLFILSYFIYNNFPRF